MTNRQGTDMTDIRLPAEWEDQEGVLLAWPHAVANWKLHLDRARQTIARIIAQITRFQRVILATTTPAEAATFLRDAKAVMERVAFYPVATNDAWARDFGPITVIEAGRPVLLDFTFNGWGGRFPAEADDVVPQGLKAHGAFGRIHLRTLHFVLEGGSIDSDGHGTLLTTASCLSNPNRNPHLTRQEIDMTLRRFLGARRVLWLEHGHLAGDDTDGHVDMLARFAPHDTVLYMECDDTRDEHFDALAAMAAELESFRTVDGKPYRLIPLPWPAPKFDAIGQRLPLSYANFLVINGAVLVPTYEDARDSLALDAIGAAFPGRKIVGVDSSALVFQHGALHCVTMQLPKGTLA